MTTDPAPAGGTPAIDAIGTLVVVPAPSGAVGRVSKMRTGGSGT